MISPVSLFAAEVQYWRLDPDAWRPVLERAVEAGLPGVSSYVPWEVHELAPGQFDFEGRTDPRRNLVRYLELVRELGLRLAYRPGPFVCNEMDWGGHPRRIVMGDHDYLVLQADGLPAPGYRIARKEGFQPSYLHPAYLDEVRRWFEAVDGVAKSFTAAHGGPIRTCNLDNEVSYIVRDSIFGSDYNPCVVGRGGLYHQWLEREYGDASQLPYARPYASLLDVAPPRTLGEDLERDLPRYFDWIRFKEWLLAEYLRVLRRFHDELGLKGVEYYTNLNPHRPEGVPTNFKRFAEATGGLVGYDFYRSPWLKYSGYASMARVLKVLRASLPVVWSAEFMGGWWYTDMNNNRVPRNHTEFMSLGAMANGCQAISWFMFHDRDNWGDSPVSEMGHPRENLDALRTVVGTARDLPAWDALAPVHDLAVVYYRPYLWHSHLGDPNPCADGKLHVGPPGLWGSEAGQAVAEYEALFRVAQQAGYVPGCVDVLDAPERLAGERVVWLAGESFIEEGAAERLKRFTSDGGTLLVTNAWPRVNLRGEPLDFLGLGGAPARGESAGGFRVAQLGRGRVAWNGTRRYACEPGAEDLEAVDELRALLQALAGPPAVEARTEPVRWRTWKEGGGADWKEEPRQLVEAILHEGGGTRLLYLVNNHERTAKATVTFRDAKTARLRELRGLGGAYEVRDGRALVDVDRKSVRVFQVT